MSCIHTERTACFLLVWLYKYRAIGINIFVWVNPPHLILLLEHSFHRFNASTNKYNGVHLECGCYVECIVLLISISRSIHSFPRYVFLLPQSEQLFCDMLNDLTRHNTWYYECELIECSCYGERIKLYYKGEHIEWYYTCERIECYKRGERITLHVSSI
jgi:hypothetical protein